LVVNAVRPASNAGVAKLTAGSGKRAAIAAGTLGVGSGATTTFDGERTGDAIAAARRHRGRRSPRPRTRWRCAAAVGRWR
jgi:hypothetical protein